MQLFVNFNLLVILVACNLVRLCGLLFAQDSLSTRVCCLWHRFIFDHSRLKLLNFFHLNIIMLLYFWDQSYCRLFYALKYALIMSLRLQILLFFLDWTFFNFKRLLILRWWKEQILEILAALICRVIIKVLNCNLLLMSRLLVLRLLNSFSIYAATISIAFISFLFFPRFPIEVRLWRVFFVFFNWLLFKVVEKIDSFCEVEGSSIFFGIRFVCFRFFRLWRITVVILYVLLDSGLCEHLFSLN